MERQMLKARMVAGVMECWSVGKMTGSSNPSLHHSIARLGFLKDGGGADLTQRREDTKAQREKQKLGKQKAEMLCRFAVLFLRIAHCWQNFSISVFPVRSCSISLLAALPPCVFATWRLCVKETSLSVKSPDSESGWFNSSGCGWPGCAFCAFLRQISATYVLSTTYTRKEDLSDQT
jgi:hypothetical protein